MRTSSIRSRASRSIRRPRTRVTIACTRSGAMAELRLPRQIELGSRGRDVRALRRALRRLGYLDIPRGEAGPGFDARTDAAVRAYQRDNGLEVDGQVGPITFGSLLPHYTRIER